MSVILRKELEAKSYPFPPHKALLDEDCFTCGESLFNHPQRSTGGIVYWQGNELIALHQSCAEELAIHLIQDARSLVTMTGLSSGEDEDNGPIDVSGVWYVTDYQERKHIKK